MIRVKVSNLYPEWPLVRQTPGRKGEFGNCTFFIDREVEACDYFVVLDDLVARQTTRCPPQNTILVTFEPPAIRSDDAKFLAQFQTIITCQRNDLKHGNLLFQQQGTPWHVGRQRKAGGDVFRFDYDFFKALAPPPKPRCASLICSSKTHTEGHRQRIALTEHLKARLGDKLDVFGAGRRDIEDKWDAIVDYKYHIAIENSTLPHYWTEKLSDAYLGWAMPFYHGCPNLGDYFPAECYRMIDPADPDAAADAIAAAIDSQLYEQSIGAIAHARGLILDRYNVFAMLAEFISQRQTSHSGASRVTIRRARSFVPIHKRIYDRLLPKRSGVQ